MPTKTKPAASAHKAKTAAKTAPVKRTRAKPAPAVEATSPSSGTKQAQLIALLRSPKGTDIEQMTVTTGWQAHTVRGTISGALRKRLGLNVACVAEGNKRVYRIVDAT